MTELLDQIKIVAGARVNTWATGEALNKSQEQWEKDNIGLIAKVESAKALQLEAEAKLRELTLKAYQETGNKAPAPGVGIREVTKMRYDIREAFKWALEHKIALSLDKRSFEGLVKTTPLDFVVVYPEPQATIAADLSKVLEEK